MNSEFTRCKLSSSVIAVSLIGVDMGHTTSKVAVRFANILRNLIPSSDVGIMEMTASAMGKLALASSTTTADYVEYEAKRAFEWLSGDRHEGRRHAAVSYASCRKNKIRLESIHNIVRLSFLSYIVINSV